MWRVELDCCNCVKVMAEADSIMSQFSKAGAEHMRQGSFATTEKKLQSMLDREESTHVFTNADVESGSDEGVSAILAAQTKKTKVSLAKAVVEACWSTEIAKKTPEALSQAIDAASQGGLTIVRAFHEVNIKRVAKTKTEPVSAPDADELRFEFADLAKAVILKLK